MSSFSGWGPTDDGRIKPDIVANGVSLYSCDIAHPADYDLRSGTSMSAPNASGSAALLVDYYEERFPGDAMRASTLKGLIIHTADDLGRAGPDYEYGWGLMNTKAAAELIKKYADGNTECMVEAVLHSTTNQSDTYSIFSGGNEALKITICWTDPPGSHTTAHDSRTPRLVNDLDLKVIGPGGTNYPFKLNYASPMADATTDSENNVDNVEQVHIEMPTAGLYTVVIDYDGTLTDNRQWYSMLVSGTAIDADGDLLPDYWEMAYFLSATGGITTVDSDGDGADNLTEYISGFDPTDPNSVFKVTGFNAPVIETDPFVINWPSIEGRIYTVEWTGNLSISPFSNISPEMPYPANSYTDTVIRAGAQQFYRVDVKLPE